MKRVHELTLDDFSLLEEGKDIPLEIWGEEVCLNGDIFFYKDNRKITPFFDEIKARLLFFDGDKDVVVQNLINDGYMNEAEENIKELALDIPVPVNEMEFRNNIHLVDLGFCIGDVDNEPTIMAYLGMTVEYFPGHVFCCYLNKENNRMKYNSVLEG